MFATKPNIDINPYRQKTIIILNGPSAAGKSSIQREIRNSFKPLFLAVGIDTFFARSLPHNFAADGQTIVNNELLCKGITSKDEYGNPIFTLIMGPAARRAITGMHRAFEAFASAGNNLVIDYILYEADWLPELVDCLKNHKVYFIGITTPLEVIEQRERTRGASPIGHARSHFNLVHEHKQYDLELDTSSLTPQEAAQKIKEFIQNNPEPQAFKKIESSLR